MSVDGLDEGVETFDGLCRLREEIDGPCEIDTVKLFRIFDNNGGIVGLALQSDDFRMVRLSVDDNLRRKRFVVFVCLVACADALLQFPDNGTGGVYHFAVSSACDPVCAWRFAVRAKQNA